MIASLSGTVRHKDLNTLTVDVSGVGYKVFVLTDTSLEAELSSPTFLWIHTAVRENALDLFGFGDREGLEIFELLITISGIGPKTALGIMNIATPTMLRQAVANEDTTYLTKVSGIGKKTAEKIVMELRGKLVAEKGDKRADFRTEGDALEALVSLGYNERDARDALKHIPKEALSTEARVKAALKLLSTHA